MYFILNPEKLNAMLIFLHRHFLFSSPNPKKQAFTCFITAFQTLKTTDFVTFQMSKIQ